MGKRCTAKSRIVAEFLILFVFRCRTRTWNGRMNGRMEREGGGNKSPSQSLPLFVPGIIPRYTPLYITQPDCTGSTRQVLSHPQGHN